MPWKIRKLEPDEKGRKWAILKKEGDSWTIVGRSATEEKAKASVRARRAGAHG